MNSEICFVTYTALEQPELHLRRHQDQLRHGQAAQVRPGVRARLVHPHSDEGHQGRVPQAARDQVRVGDGQTGSGGQHHHPQLRQELPEASPDAQIHILEFSQQTIPSEHHHSG